MTREASGHCIITVFIDQLNLLRNDAIHSKKKLFGLYLLLPKSRSWWFIDQRFYVWDKRLWKRINKFVGNTCIYSGIPKVRYKKMKLQRREHLIVWRLITDGIGLDGISEQWTPWWCCKAIRKNYLASPFPRNVFPHTFCFIMWTHVTELSPFLHLM